MTAGPSSDAPESCPCGESCPIESVFRYVGGKWKMRIICRISLEGSVRYNALKRMVEGISPTMLSQSLTELEEDGLVNRKTFDEKPLRVEYSLTEKAESLIPILLDLRKWAAS